MAEYIERETLLNKTYDITTTSGTKRVVMYDDVVLAPAADVAPVVHGSLKHTGTLWSSLWICTKCKGVAYYPPHGNRKKRIIQPCGYKFCPNCGAKMDEEVNT